MVFFGHYIYVCNLNNSVFLKAGVNRCFVKKLLRKTSQKSRKNTCVGACNFYEKEALAQFFFCEFCKFNSFFAEHLRVTVSIEIRVFS